jgi:hypothetical protein
VFATGEPVVVPAQDVCDGDRNDWRHGSSYEVETGVFSKAGQGVECCDDETHVDLANARLFSFFPVKPDNCD